MAHLQKLEIVDLSRSEIHNWRLALVEQKALILHYSSKLNRYQTLDAGRDLFAFQGGLARITRLYTGHSKSCAPGR